MRISPLFAVAGLTVVLWVVPSLGTQGMGTLGQRFDHADRDLLESSLLAGDVRPALYVADASVEALLQD